MTLPTEFGGPLPDRDDPDFETNIDALFNWFLGLPAQVADMSASDWFQVLGVVSQSGGVPSGSILEAGTNANGRYLRTADGSQICHQEASANSSADAIWTFPAEFSTTIDLVIHVTARSAANAIIGGARAPSTLAVDWNAHNTAGARTATPCSLLAVGRWF